MSHLSLRLGGGVAGGEGVAPGEPQVDEQNLPLSRKRKRSTFRTDYEESQNSFEGSQASSPVSFQYHVPQAKRRALNPAFCASSRRPNEGDRGGVDTVYLIFEEYLRLYSGCRPLITGIQRLLGIEDDLEKLQRVSRHNGYVDSVISAVYQPAFVDLGDDWLAAMLTLIDDAQPDMDLDIAALRNWRLIMLHISSSEQSAPLQVIIHDICDHNGVSHLSHYLLSESTLINSIGAFHRADTVQTAQGLARIVEISAYNNSHYALSPYKCLSLVALDHNGSIDVRKGGHSAFRYSPWEVRAITPPQPQPAPVSSSSSSSSSAPGANGDASSAVVVVDDDDEAVVDDGTTFATFLHSDLVSILPSETGSNTINMLLQELKRLISQPSVSVEQRKRSLFAVTRNMSYELLCLEESGQSQLNNAWVTMLDRLIHLGDQQNLIDSVQDLIFPAL